MLREFDSDCIKFEGKKCREEKGIFLLIQKTENESSFCIFNLSYKFLIRCRLFEMQTLYNI